MPIESIVGARLLKRNALPGRPKTGYGLMLQGSIGDHPVMMMVRVKTNLAVFVWIGDTTALAPQSGGVSLSSSGMT